MGNLKPRLCLFGAFRLEDASGARININSIKAQAMLAMLATSSNGERSRAWLKSSLWSDRAPEQASGSLRQMLTYLRRILTPIGILLETDRARVALDLDSFEQPVDEAEEFLEGIDLRDEAFEDWLREKRHEVNRPAARQTADTPLIRLTPDSGWSISILPQTAGQGLERWFECLFADDFARRLREVFAAPIQVNADPTLTEHTITVNVESFSAENGFLTLRIIVDHPAQHNRVWSGHCTVVAKGAPPMDHPDLLRLMVEMVEILGDYMAFQAKGDEPEDPDKMCRLAIRSMFTMNADKIAEADSLFENAFLIKPRGLYLAWRAQLKAIQSVEKIGGDQSALAEEGTALCERALEIEPNNSMVLATIANASRRFLRDDFRSLAMAQRSVNLNPANPMAWSAYANASAYMGDEKTAYRAAIAAHNLVKLSPNRFWFDSQRFVSALPQGKLEEAITFAEMAHSGNPSFRPPLRYLIALYANDGRTQDALRAAEKLKYLEQDFSIQRLLEDTEYPASLLHKTPGLDREKIARLC